MFDQPKYLCIHCWRITKADNLFCEHNSSNNHDPEAEGKRRLGELYPLSLFERMSEFKPNLYEHARKKGRMVVCECGKEILPKTKLPTDSNPAIRIAGPQSSGKTLFIATILPSLEGRPLNVGLLGIGDTIVRLNEISSALLNGQRPNLTREGEAERYAWQIVDDAPERPLLVIHDIAGETWENLNNHCPEDLSRYLALPGHLILVLDGATIADDLGLEPTDAWDSKPRPGDRGAMDLAILGYITDHLGNEQENIKLALVITKADLLWDKYPELKEACSSLSKNEAKQELFMTLLRRSHRGNLITTAKNCFQETRIFATSSLGIRPNNAIVQPNPQPLGTIIPLLWLLDIEYDEQQEGDLYEHTSTASSDLY